MNPLYVEKHIENSSFYWGIMVPWMFKIEFRESEEGTQFKFTAEEEDLREMHSYMFKPENAKKIIKIDDASTRYEREMLIDYFSHPQAKSYNGEEFVRNLDKIVILAGGSS